MRDFKNIIWFLFLAYVLSACGSSNKGHKEDILYQIFGEVQLNPTIRNYLKVFIDSADCTDCIYNLYIDKVVDKSEVIYSFECLPYFKSYLLEKKPLFYLTVDGIRIYLYTGIEDSMFSKDVWSLPDSTKYTNIDMLWNLIYKDGRYTLRMNGSTPFFPLSDEKHFKIPPDF